MLNVIKPTVPVRVGVIGGGQLARMMGEAAHEVMTKVIVLAESPDDPAIETCDEFLIGSPQNMDDLRALQERCDVITFDHEQVNVGLLAQLELELFPVRPNIGALPFAVDKAHQRRFFAGAGLPLPRFLIVDGPENALLTPFLDSLDGPPVVKATRGGYDGRGVLFPDSREEALQFIGELSEHYDVLVEERLNLVSEVAQLVTCDVDLDPVFYPLVTTVQANGMCVETIYPCALSETLQAQALEISAKVAKTVGAVGNIAIEYFVTEKGLCINEVALRPHNSGHWTIEGTETSQFANHLLAVSGQALGSTDAVSSNVVMVNVIGGSEPGSSSEAAKIDGVYVHDYAKAWRPGRKLGHVTALGDNAHDVRMRAWMSARIFGTPDREA